MTLEVEIGEVGLRRPDCQGRDQTLENATHRISVFGRHLTQRIRVPEVEFDQSAAR